MAQTKAKRTKKSVSRRPQTCTPRRGIAKRGGWVDQQVAEILRSPASLEEKTRLVYEILSAKPPIRGDHLSPLEVIRTNLARRFPSLADDPDGPLAPKNMPGTLYLVLANSLEKWKAPNGRRRQDGRASFITFLTNRLTWLCLRLLEQVYRQNHEIPLSVFLRRGWDDQDATDEDYVLGLGFVPITEECL
jgi:hypothetical protein